MTIDGDTDFKSMVSVVIPCYNDGRLAIDAVASCLFQEKSSWVIEVLLVDDGSTDGSSGMVAARYENDARVRIFQKQNGGLASARNHGMSQARGDWIVFLDADDVLAPEYFFAVTRVLQACGPKQLPDLLITPFCYVQGGEEVSLQRRVLSWLMHVPRFVGWSCWDQFLIRTGNCYPVSACVVSTRFLAEIGVFDVELKAHEDWDFWIRAIDEGARVAYVPPLMAAATLIRLRRGMSADAGLMKRTRAVVRRRHCTSWPGLLLLSGPVLAAVLALRTIVGLWECRVLGRRSNLT